MAIVETYRLVKRALHTLKRTLHRLKRAHTLKRTYFVATNLL